MNFDLKARREALGMTQTELADHLGIAANTVARWERGEREPEGGNILDLALRYLEITKSRTSEVRALARKIKPRTEAISAATKKVSARRRAG